VTSQALDRLMGLMPPPPMEVAAPPWEQSRSEIGFDFPEDYREFVNRYGGGSIVSDVMPLKLSIRAPHIGALAPGRSAGFSGFLDEHITQVRPAFVFEGADEDYWGGTVYPVYPDPGGLLSWGESQDGDFFFWLTQDTDANRWPTVLWARQPGMSFRFDEGLLSSLVSIFTGAHAASEWLGGPGLRWTMHSDWLRKGLEISAGPA
jgi:hypothetical protein